MHILKHPLRSDLIYEFTRTLTFQEFLQLQLARQQQLQQTAAAQMAAAQGLGGVGLMPGIGRPLGLLGGVPVVKPTISFEEAMTISKKARVIQFGNLPEDKELQDGLAAFLNELFKALKLNTIGGDACIGSVVEEGSKSAVVEFRTTKEASLAKTTLVTNPKT